MLTLLIAHSKEVVRIALALHVWPSAFKSYDLDLHLHASWGDGYW